MMKMSSKIAGKMLEGSGPGQTETVEEARIILLWRAQ
jgi:hypothetical protein